MTRGAWPLVPGVPAAGHVTAGGWWHPGRVEGCGKCPAPDCACGHSQLLHQGLHGRCLATVGGGSEEVPRRMSRLCCEVGGGCSRFRGKR